MYACYTIGHFLNEEIVYKRGRAREERVTKNGGSCAPSNEERQLRAIFAAYTVKISAKHTKNVL